MENSLKDINIILLVVSLFLCGLMLFGLYEDYDNNPLSKTSHMLYQATSRFIWAVGLSYLIYACLNSGGGINLLIIFILILILL
jgi:hypothetical protein